MTDRQTREVKIRVAKAERSRTNTRITMLELGGWQNMTGMETKHVTDLQSYPYTVSDKNVAQGT